MPTSNAHRPSILDQLKALRTARPELSLAAIAKASGVPYATVNALFQGGTQGKLLAALAAIGPIFGVELVWSAVGASAASISKGEIVRTIPGAGGLGTMTEYIPLRPKPARHRKDPKR